MAGDSRETQTSGTDSGGMAFEEQEEARSLRAARLLSRRQDSGSCGGKGL